MWFLRKKSRIVGMISVLLIVCTVTWYFGSYTDSFKAAVTTYTDGEESAASTLSELVITSGGNSAVGSKGSMAEPVSGIVPTCGYVELGEDENDEDIIKKNGKGGERNPFVILEIVPEEAMQQLTLLNTSNPNYCVDWMQVGVDSGKKFVNMSQQDFFNNIGFSNTYGYWLDSFEYQVLKFGTTVDNPEYETTRFLQPGVVYNITVTKSDVTEAGYDYDEFLSDVNNTTKMADMQTKYPKLFKKATADKTDTDEEGTYKKKGIRNIAINDEQNWVRSDNLGDTFEFTMDNEFTSTELGITDINNVDAPEVVKNNETLFKSKLWDDKKKAAVEDYANWSCTLESTTTEDLYVENKQNGYYYYTSDNSGDYDFEANYWVASLGGAAFIAKPTTNGHWKYVETLDQIPAGKTEKTSMSMNDAVDQGWNGVANCYVSCDTIRSGLNFVISKTLDVGHYKFSYKYVPQLEEEPTFKFKYWSIKNEDVLKRSLFVFDNEEQCENFNLQVVCMTPSQINKLAKEDTDEKIDIIERADLFYISTIDKNITNYDKVVKFYNEHVNKTGKDVDVNNLKSFANDDLEWDLCMKILKRCSDNPNLPLMYNKPVGLLLDYYADESIDMYVGEHQNGDTKSYSSTINNIGKMYMMSLQFDLQAGTQSSESKIEYQQTLFGDNGLANRIHTVKLSEEITDKMEPDSAKYTGWFEPAVIKNEKSKYLWNRYTFYPGGVPNGSSIDTYMQYGYLKTYLKTYPFEKDNDTNESKYEHLEGTDGDVDDNNVTVVRSGSLADTNRSTMISLTEGSDIVNDMMEILFKIMNNGKDPEAGNLNLAVRSHKKYYTRISDNSVLLDYTLDAKYTNASEKIIYLKVSIANPTGEMKNLEPGSVNSVVLVNDSGDEIAVDVYDTIGGDPKEKEEIYDEIFDKTDTTHFLYGYRVPLENPLVIYVPFTLEQWQDGYHSVEFKLQGMTYNAKKKVCVLGTETTETVDIGERPLFNLE